MRSQPAHFDFRCQKNVDVVRHDRIGMQVVRMEFGYACLEPFDDTIGDARILEPQRPGFSAIEYLIGPPEFLACEAFVLAARTGQECSRQGTIQSPSQEDRSSQGEPMRKIAAVVDHGAGVAQEFLLVQPVSPGAQPGVAVPRTTFSARGGGGAEHGGCDVEGEADPAVLVRDLGVADQRIEEGGLLRRHLVARFGVGERH